MTREEQKKQFRQNKAIYDAAPTPEAKKEFVKELNNPKSEGFSYTPYTASQKTADAQYNREQASTNLQNVANKQNLVDKSVYDTMGNTFKAPSEVTKANAYLSALLKQIQAGKTSYSDKINELMGSISGRDKFTYDVDSDPLFQQALGSAMKSGKAAMQDTMGQAASLTGGYGSSYATSAANQAYNAYIEDAYANLPQYYQMALEAYRAEGDDLYRQLEMYTMADDSEYGRILNAYNATSDYRNQAYGEAYTAFRDTKTDAYNTANLRMNENSQLVSNAQTAYNTAADYADSLFSREYDQWMDSINLALKEYDINNTEKWKNIEYNRGVLESDRNFEENQRQYNDSQYWSNYWNKQDQANWEKQYLASRNDAAQDQANWEKEYKVTTGDMDGNGILSKTEIEKLKKINSSGSGKTTEEKPRTGFKFDSTEKANIRNIYNEAYDEAIKAGASVDDANMQAATVLENYLAENSFSNLNSAEEDIIAQIIGSDAKYYKLDGKHYTEDELWEAIKKKYPKATQTGLSMLHKAIISGEISDVSAEFIEELFNKK